MTLGSRARSLSAAFAWSLNTKVVSVAPRPTSQRAQDVSLRLASAGLEGNLSEPSAERHKSAELKPDAPHQCKQSVLRQRYRSPTDMRFLVTYLAPASVIAEWKKTEPETRKAAEEKMQAQWKKWMSDHAKIFADFGAGVGKGHRRDYRVRCQGERRHHRAGRSLRRL